MRTKIDDLDPNRIWSTTEQRAVIGRLKELELELIDIQKKLENLNNKVLNMGRDEGLHDHGPGYD